MEVGNLISGKEKKGLFSSYVVLARPLVSHLQKEREHTNTSRAVQRVRRTHRC